MKLDHSVQKIYNHWAQVLGTNFSSLQNEKSRVIEHSANLVGYKGAFFIRSEHECIYSVPHSFLQILKDKLPLLAVDDVFNKDFLLDFFGLHVDSIIGPTYLGYVTNATFIPTFTHSVVLLNKSHRDQLYRLKENCSNIEWEHSDIDINCKPIMGCFIGERLVAAGSLKETCDISSIGILTHPQFRGRELGKAIVSKLTRYGIDKGKIIQYQTLEENTSSVAIANSLGYKKILQSISVRFNEETTKLSY